MINRIVKMTFEPDKVDEFLAIFEKNKMNIRNFPGVTKLELLQDRSAPNIFFTYSAWDDGHSLEAYRRSELFRSVWTKTKALFSDKAEAWSVDKRVDL